MMKAFFTLAVLTLAGSPLLAQPPSNAIFFGGVADGHSARRNTPLPPVNQGGGGAGYGHSINGREPVGLVINQRGGIGDGWASNFVITSLAPPVALPQQNSFPSKHRSRATVHCWTGRWATKTA